jgi:hypothetical protein
MQGQLNIGKTVAFEVNGKLHRAFDTEQKTDKFRAREFVLEIEDGQYPQMIKFQLTQEKCEMLDDYNEGDELTVHFDLRGREWNGKYFTNLNAWRLSAATQASTQGSAQAMPATENQPPPGNERDYDEIPF